jgi:hypothetical protein
MKWRICALPIVSPAFLPCIMQAARNLTPTFFYNGLRILWGYGPDDGAVILPFTEVGAGGGAAQTSSLYVVAYGDERTFAIEGTPLSVEDEGNFVKAISAISVTVHLLKIGALVMTRPEKVEASN